MAIKHPTDLTSSVWRGNNRNRIFLIKSGFCHKTSIKTYQELLRYEGLPADLAEQARQKIAELKNKLEQITGAEISLTV